MKTLTLFLLVVVAGCATQTSPSSGPGTQATNFTQKIKGTWRAIQTGGDTFNVGSILVIGSTTIDYLGRGQSPASFRWKDGILLNLDSSNQYFYTEHDKSTGLPAFVLHFYTNVAHGGSITTIRIDSNALTMSLLDHDSLVASSTADAPERFPSWLFVRTVNQGIHQPVDVETDWATALMGNWVCLDSVPENISYSFKSQQPISIYARDYRLVISKSLWSSTDANLIIRDTSYEFKIYATLHDSIYQSHDTNFLVRVLQPSTIAGFQDSLPWYDGSPSRDSSSIVWRRAPLQTWSLICPETGLSLLAKNWDTLTFYAGNRRYLHFVRQ